MQRSFPILACVALGALSACADATIAAPARELVAFTRVSIIDASAESARPNMTVVVRDGRIVAVGPSDSAAVPAGARVVAGEGKYLIPGLWDMHAHSAIERNFRDVVLPLLAVHGVTGARVFGTPALPTVIREVREAIASGTRLGPYLVVSTLIVGGADPPGIGFLNAQTAAEGAAAVDSLRALGSDFIKIYNGVPRPAYFALAARARAVKLPFAGHVPFTVTAGEASDSGQASIEHLTGVLLGCSSYEAAGMRELDAERVSRQAGTSIGLRLAAIRTSGAALAAFDEAKCDSLIARFARNGTRHTPTLVALERRAYHSQDSLAADPWLAMVPKSIVEEWNPKGRVRREYHEQRDAESERAAYGKHLELVKRMHGSGVPILAGSDNFAQLVIPGISLHNELALLVRAGLTPHEALRAATSEPARFLGLSDSVGVIAPGMRADLVLLQANPLTDIQNTKRIEGVMMAGRFLDAAARTEVLERVKKTARQK